MRARDGAECPLLAISGHAERCARESALPPKADIHDGFRVGGYQWLGPVLIDQPLETN